MFGNYRTLTYVALVVILGFFVVRPQWSLVQDLRAGVDEYAAVLANISSYNEQITSLLRRRDALSVTETNRLQQFIGAEGVQAAQIVYNLEQAVYAHGLSLVAVHRGAGIVGAGAISAADFVTQEVELTVSGTYDAFKGFIREIESTLEPYTITYMKFNNENASDILSFTIRVRVSALSL